MFSLPRSRQYFFGALATLMVALCFQLAPAQTDDPTDGETDPVKLASLAQRQLKAKRPQLERALHGHLTPNQRFVLRELLGHWEELEAADRRVTKEIDGYLQDRPKLARARDKAPSLEWVDGDLALECGDVDWLAADCDPADSRGGNAAAHRRNECDLVALMRFEITFDVFLVDGEADRIMMPAERGELADQVLPDFCDRGAVGKIADQLGGMRTFA